MATITSAQSGNWEDSTTWVGGVVPTQDDNVVISEGHIVTVNADVINTSSVTISGELVISDAITFYIGDYNTSKNSTLYLHGGAVSGAGTLYIGRGYVESNGTQWSYVKCKILNARTSSFVSWNCIKVAFTDMESVNLYQGTTKDGVVEPKYIFEDCTFVRCTGVQFTLNGWATYATDIALAKCTFSDVSTIFLENINIKNFSAESCVFYGSTDARLQIRLNASATFSFNKCVFINTYPWLGRYFTYDNCYFSGDDSSSGAYITGIGDYHDDGLLTNSLIYVPETVVNGRPINHRNVNHCFVEDNSTGGTNTFLATRTINWNNNVFISHGSTNGFTSLPVANELAVYNISNNTAVTDSTFGALEWYTPSSESVLTYKNNLHTTRTLDSGRTFLATMHGIVGPINVVFKNNHAHGITPETWYDSAVLVPAADSTNVIKVERTYPQFFDDSRKQSTWAVSVAGLADGEYTTTWHYLRGLNGFEEDTGVHSGITLPSTTITDMYAWLMAGYVPQNMALATAGEGGTFVGAVVPKAPTEAADLSMVAVPTSLQVGNSVTYTVTLSKALSTALNVVITSGGVEKSATIASGNLSASVPFVMDTVGTIAATANTDNTNVTYVSGVVNVVVVEDIPPTGGRDYPINVSYIDAESIMLNNINGVTGALQVTLTYAKG